jgi:serine/threonine-protein kinase
MAQENPLEFGEYRVIRRIGKGGFGAVYLTENPLFPDRAFAVKAFHHLDEDEEETSLFVEELKHVLGLSHSHIVQVRGFGIENRGETRQPYIVMDFIEGPNGGSYNLKQHLRAEGGTFEPSDVKRLFKQILSALSLVHNRRIAHLDLKPENILLDKDLNAYISDFGVSRTVSAQATIMVRDGPSIQGFSPLYASPEQIRHSYGSRHSDIFSLGVILVECLTGSRPEILHSKTAPRVDFVRPSSVGLSREWDSLLENCLSIDPAYRFPNASVFLRALKQISTSGPEGEAVVTHVQESDDREAAIVHTRPEKEGSATSPASTTPTPPFQGGTISKLLEMSRSDAGKVEPAPKPDAEEGPERSPLGLPRRLTGVLGLVCGLVFGVVLGWSVGEDLGDRYSLEIGSFVSGIVGTKIGGWIGINVGRVLGVIGFGLVCSALGVGVGLLFGYGIERLISIALKTPPEEDF